MMNLWKGYRRRTWSIFVFAELKYCPWPDWTCIETSYPVMQVNAKHLHRPNGKFCLQLGVANYRRWSMVSADLPCTRQRGAQYEIAGKTSFADLDFYSCCMG